MVLIRPLSDHLSGPHLVRFILTHQLSVVKSFFKFVLDGFILGIVFRFGNGHAPELRLELRRQVPVFQVFYPFVYLPVDLRVTLLPVLEEVVNFLLTFQVRTLVVDNCFGEVVSDLAHSQLYLLQLHPRRFLFVVDHFTNVEYSLLHLFHVYLVAVRADLLVLADVVLQKSRRQRLGLVDF